MPPFGRRHRKPKTEGPPAWHRPHLEGARCPDRATGGPAQGTPGRQRRAVVEAQSKLLIGDQAATSAPLGGGAFRGLVENPAQDGRCCAPHEEPVAARIVPIWVGVSKQIAHAPQQAVWSADTPRQPVPVARDEERSMPNA